MGGMTLVTGATGFVGSAVARVLQERGHRLRLMVRKGTDRANLAGLDAEIVEGDLLSPESFAPALAGCRHLFHVAADYRLWVPDPPRMMRANVDGTRLLMQAALEAGCERIVYCSSVAALGLRKDGGSADEETPVTEREVIGVYKLSKYRAEQVVLRMIAEQNLPAVIVNPSTPIGPRDIKPTPTGQMIVDCASGRMPAYVETGLNIVHVDDVAEGHVLALERGRIGQKYILGGENHSLGALFRMVAEVAGVRPPRVKLSQDVLYPVAVVSEWLARGFGIEPRVTRETLAMSRKLMYFSSAKAERELGYAPRPARAAVTDAVEWFRAHGRIPR
ncbi:hopanoid-associated sugar epimerase [Acidomonas methanolica]|uniref:Epimerase/dehydratase n=1 Tax=Acidomonas methanolica NBRC 104435 TaxID=1231351 RepID=A0A023D544_ACIMT|nr:hopanoid-associated sugar epimerase [Acidomonas methanolica]MBU2654289.1 NAD-dependent epimerase/dehydratase family protein [Acidomonas methanolica]TCS29272.1 dihydroflavonol-4-reductase [Acidomonas methanolica]GAJ28931.1 epimerase/dehydratase [Acidomonas methanolica NBRC 104435]GBQ52774.1 epimerase [Acidomonas methanolica]GEK99294.1 NAD-dependent dehydratase [Acidomonas methanolica NBRC 104435]